MDGELLQFSAWSTSGQWQAPDFHCATTGGFHQRSQMGGAYRTDGPAVFFECALEGGAARTETDLSGFRGIGGVFQLDLTVGDADERQPVQTKQDERKLRLVGDKAHLIDGLVAIGQQVQLTGLTELAGKLDDRILSGT